MCKGHPNYQLVKIHRNYPVEEIARLFGTYKNIVRARSEGRTAHL